MADGLPEDPDRSGATAPSLPLVCTAWLMEEIKKCDKMQTCNHPSQLKPKLA